MTKVQSKELLFKISDESDIADIVKLVNSAYRGESSKKGWTTEADLLGGQRTDPDAIKEIINSESEVILLFKNSENRVVGSVYLKKETEQVCYLGMLTVDPNIQAKGFGKTILNEAENFCRKNWYANKIRMTVISARVELIAWYQRRGYNLTGEIEPFPMHDERFGILKVSSLEFVVLEKKIDPHQ